QAIENLRYIDLELSVTGGPATTLQQYRRIHRLWIEDNDFFPPEVILYKEDFESASHGFTQVTVASGANQWARGTGANMGSGNAYYITNNPSGTPPPYTYTLTSTSRVAAVTPAINTTNATDLVLAFDVLVGGEYNDANGNMIDFGRLFFSTTAATTGFQPIIGCAWTSNTCAMHTVARSHALYGYPNQVRRIILPLPAATWNQPNLWLAWRWDNNGSGGTQPPLAIDNIVLYGRKMPAIESATASASVYLGPGDSVYAYSGADGELMACLVNLGTSNHGCTQVQIDRVGNSAQALRPGHTAAEYVTDKTFRVQPASNTAPNYAITLYYSNAEVAGYESATGGNWNTTPYVVRTAGSIADEYNAPTPTFQVSASRAVGTYGTTGRWIRGTFSNFSGFAAGNPSVSTSLFSSMGGGFWVASPVRDEIVLGTAAPFQKLRIVSLEGKLLWESEGAFETGVYRISAPTLPTGMYIAQAVEKGGTVLFQQKVLYARCKRERGLGRRLTVAAPQPFSEP
ncbi:MAG: hypothetical protein RMK98_05170, partial [Bacteroidia bacterium]|nr:hypothetical protein [Bacteroidia bacterium]